MIKNPLLNIVSFTLVGAVLTLLGLGLGLGLGASYGGNFQTFFQYGGLAGYEGTGLLGGMIGAALASLGLIALWFRKNPLLKPLLFIYAGTWLVATVAQHVIGLMTGNGSFLPIGAPIILTGIAAYFLAARR